MLRRLLALAPCVVLSLAPLVAAAAPPSSSSSKSPAPPTPVTLNDASLEWLLSRCAALTSDSSTQQIDTLSRMLQLYREQRAMLVRRRDALQAQRNTTQDPATAASLDAAIAALNAQIASIDGAIVDIEDRLATLYESHDRSH